MLQQLSTDLAIVGDSSHQVSPMVLTAEPAAPTCGKWEKNVTLNQMFTFACIALTSTRSQCTQYKNNLTHSQLYTSGSHNIVHTCLIEKFESLYKICCFTSLFIYNRFLYSAIPEMIIAL